MSETIRIPLDALPDDSMQTCVIADREILVFRRGCSAYAVDNQCTHARARLSEGRLRGTRIICPLHGASFDLRDGRVMGAPATRPLLTHTALLLEDCIEVTLHPNVP